MPNPTQKYFTLQICRGEGFLATTKNKLFFCHFSLPRRKISSGFQSDNFDPRRPAYGSSESLCLKFFKTPMRNVIIFNIVGASPPQSKVIQNCVRHNERFSGNFLEKNINTNQYVIHGWKAMDLSLLKV